MKRGLIVIGIDGGTFRVIDPLIEKGELPNMKKLIKSGVKGILKSTYPPITAAAWVSFMTGKNPGKHGFFDFREYNPNDYTPSFVPRTKDAVREDVSALHSSRFHGETIWDMLGNAGYEQTIVAVPMTYPPWEINGRMVSGYPCPDYNKPKTYPAEWGEEIGRLFNLSAIDYTRMDGMIKECKELVRRKGKIILDQLKNKRGNVFSVVFSSTDFVQHYLWRCVEEQNYPYSSAIDEIHQEVDAVLGEILDLVSENTSIIVMSDHGFMSHPKKYFNLNSWLMLEKYIYLKQGQKSSKLNIFSNFIDILVNQVVYKKLKWKQTIKEKVTIMPLFVQKWVSKQYFKSNLLDWDRTRAFRFRMYATVDGVVINRRGRQKHGIVEKGHEYEQLREEIIRKLLEIKDPDTGTSVIAEVYKREEIYKGDFLENAPDVIVRFNSEFIGGLETDTDIITPVPVELTDVFTGIHSQDGIFIFCGPNVEKGIEIDPVNIVDISPTILYDLNVPVPDDLDGRVIENAFLDTYKTKPPRYIAVEKRHKKTREDLSEEDEESVKKALKGLGYLS